MNQSVRILNNNTAWMNESPSMATAELSNRCLLAPTLARASALAAAISGSRV